MAKKSITWIDGAAAILADTHSLQFGFVKKWIIEQHITSDMIQGYRRMESGTFLEFLYMRTSK